MRSVCMLVPLACVACGAPDLRGLELVGEPVDPNGVAAYVRAYAAYTGNPNGLEQGGTIDVRPFAAFSQCGPGAPTDACPNESLDSGTGARFYIVVDAPGAAPFNDWRFTSLAHELTHALYGDVNHTRADLWGPTGLVARWNGWVEGHNPAHVPAPAP